ncbi:SDR family oxidoreductase [Larkinella insperata]|uniref:SDR family oxidoreductase n=1 Tax=Larkinella insperata TaxID=332158 RepID=A0ABW3QJ66_9BACT|nr:NAD(P)H-binding protein [Larkinella insperata]
MNIAVLGATGLIGKPVTEQLIAAGYTVTILARNPDKAKALFPKARIVRADLRNPESLRAGLQNQQAVYLNLSVRQAEKPGDFHTETDGMKILLDEARRAGVRRIGYMSSLVMRYQGMNGFDWWVFEVKHEAVRLLKQSGLPVTIFYPSTFMESFSMQTQGPVLPLAGQSDVRMWFVAGQDYGRQVARALQLPGDQNREYVVQGPEAHTYEAGAKLFVDQYAKRKLTLVKAPLGVLKFLGRFSRTVNYGAHIVEALNRYPESFEAEQTWTDLGPPTLTIGDYAQQAP